MMIEQAKMCQGELDKRALQERVVQEGINLWQKQKERERTRKLQEQKEIKDMLERYWPWGKGTDAKPRGLRNLRLEELFPNQDYQNAKRAVCTLDHGGGGAGTGGGGAPIYHGGRKVTRTKADPLLRFRLGDANLRRCVDNTLRYKTDREAQLNYKMELDKMVEEKKLQKLREKLEEDSQDRAQFWMPAPWGSAGPGGRPWRHPNAVGLDFFQSMGWSNEDTMKRLGADKENMPKLDEKKKTKNCPANRTVKLEPLQHPPKKAFVPACKSRKLSPSSIDGGGVELVPLLAGGRRRESRAPLCSTDVTSEKKMGSYECLWNRQGSAYLKELSQQMVTKQQRLKELKEDEEVRSKRHFNTWSGFWGRPGHGAPQPDCARKLNLDRLLYPSVVPVGVH